MSSFPVDFHCKLRLMHPKYDQEDSIDIENIGRLYQGLWSRRYYFSDSRAKSRLPFPIGYTAVRTYCGHDFRLVILEGERGPKFEVSCEDGFVESGDSPDVAWSAILKRKHGHSFAKRKKDSAKKSSGLEAYGFKKHAVKLLLNTLLETPAHIITFPTTPRQRPAIGAALQSSLALLKEFAVEDFKGPDDRQGGNVGLAADFDFQSSEEVATETGHISDTEVAAAMVQNVPVSGMEMVRSGGPGESVKPVSEGSKERCKGELRTYRKRKKDAEEVEKPESKCRQSTRLKRSGGVKHKQVPEKKQKMRSNHDSKMSISEDSGQGVLAPILLQPAAFFSTASPKQPSIRSDSTKSAPSSRVKPKNRSRRGGNVRKNTAAVPPLLPPQTAISLVVPPLSPPPPPPLAPSGNLSIKAQSQPSSPHFSPRITEASTIHTPEDRPCAVGIAKIATQDSGQCCSPLVLSVPAEKVAFVIATVLKTPEEVDLMALTEPDPGPLSAAEGEELTSRLTKAEATVGDDSLGSSLEGAGKNCGLLTQMARVAGNRMKEAQAVGTADANLETVREDEVVMGLEELAEAAVGNDQLATVGSQDEEREMVSWSLKGRRNSRGRVKARRVSPAEPIEAVGDQTNEWKSPCTGIFEAIRSSPTSSELRVEEAVLEEDTGSEGEDDLAEEWGGTGRASGELAKVGGIREDEIQGTNVTKGVMVAQRGRAAQNEGQDVMSQMERHNSQHQTQTITLSRQVLLEAPTGAAGQEPVDVEEERFVGVDADQTPCLVLGSPGGGASGEADAEKEIVEAETKEEEVESRTGNDARGDDGGEGEGRLKGVPNDVEEEVHLPVQANLSGGNNVRVQASGTVCGDVKDRTEVEEGEGRSKGGKSRGKKVSVLEIAKASSAGAGLMDMWTRRHTSKDTQVSATAATDAGGAGSAAPPCQIFVPKTPANGREREVAGTLLQGQVAVPEAKQSGGWIKPKEKVPNQVPGLVLSPSNQDSAVKQALRQKNPSPQKLTFLPSPPRPAPQYKPLQLTEPPLSHSRENGIQATSLRGYDGTTLGSRVTGGRLRRQRQPLTDMGLAFNSNEIRSLNTTNGLHGEGKENKVGGGRLQGEDVSGRKEVTVGRTQEKGDNGKLSLPLPPLESSAIVSHPCELPPPEGRQAQPKPQPTSQPVVKPRGWDFNRTGELNPVCCVKHPLPVQALKVHGGEGGRSGLLLVCCGEENSDHLQVLVYQILLNGDSCHLVSSLALRAAGEEGEAIHFEGIAIAPSGAHLAFVDSFEHTASKSSKKAVRVTPFRCHGEGGGEGVESDALELETDVAMRCLLAPDGGTLVAAGEGGKIQCWQWANSKVFRPPSARWHLPPAHFKGIPFLCLRQLAVVPGQPHLVIGRDSGGSLAVWDICTRTLLTATHPLSHLIVSVSVLGPTKATAGTGPEREPHAELAVGVTSEGAPAVSPQLVPLNLIVTVKRKAEELGEEAGDAQIQSGAYSCHLAWLRAGAIVITHKIDSSATSACGVGPLGMLGCHDGSVCLWNVTTGAKVASMQEMSGSAVRHLAAHPMLPIAAAASSDGHVMVYMQEGAGKGAEVA